MQFDLPGTFEGAPPEIIAAIAAAIQAGVGLEREQLEVIENWYNQQDANQRQQIQNKWGEFQENIRQFDVEQGRADDEFRQKFGLSIDQFNEQKYQFDVNQQQSAYQFARQIGLDETKFGEAVHQFDVMDEREKQQFAAQLGLDYDRLNSTIQQFNATEQRARDEFASTLGFDRDKFNEATRQFGVVEQRQREQFGEEMGFKREELGFEREKFGGELGFRREELGVKEEAGKETERSRRAELVLNAPRGPADFFAYTSRLKGLQESGELGDFLGGAMEESSGRSMGELSRGPVLTGTQYAQDMARAARGEQVGQETQGFLQGIGAGGHPVATGGMSTAGGLASMPPVQPAVVGNVPIVSMANRPASSGGPVVNASDTAITRSISPVRPPKLRPPAAVRPRPTYTPGAPPPIPPRPNDNLEPEDDEDRPTRAFARGTTRVGRTGEAVVHEGEMIIPAELAMALREVLDLSSNDINSPVPQRPNNYTPPIYPVRPGGEIPVTPPPEFPTRPPSSVPPSHRPPPRGFQPMPEVPRAPPSTRGGTPPPAVPPPAWTAPPIIPPPPSPGSEIPPPPPPPPPLDGEIPPPPPLDGEIPPVLLEDPTFGNPVQTPGSAVAPTQETSSWWPEIEPWLPPRTVLIPEARPGFVPEPEARPGFVPEPGSDIPPRPLPPEGSDIPPRPLPPGLPEPAGRLTPGFLGNVGGGIGPAISVQMPPGLPSPGDLYDGRQQPSSNLWEDLRGPGYVGSPRDIGGGPSWSPSPVVDFYEKLSKREAAPEKPAEEEPPEKNPEEEPPEKNPEEDSYAIGSTFVPQTQEARVHAQEMRVPLQSAQQVRAMTGIPEQPAAGQGFLAQIGQLGQRRPVFRQQPSINRGGLATAQPITAAPSINHGGRVTAQPITAAPPTGFGSSIQSYSRLDPTARQMFFGALGERGGQMETDFLYGLRKAAPIYQRSARARMV